MGILIRLANDLLGDYLKFSTVFATAALLMFAITLTGCASSQNADACNLYEAAHKEMDTTVQVHGTISDSDYTRSVFEELPDEIALAVERAHGDVLVEMKESYQYAVKLVEKPTDNNGTAFFMHRNNVVEACEDDGAGIDLDGE